MTTFLNRQQQRDALAILDGTPGDECRRWSTCDSCGEKSRELEYAFEQWHWEQDHLRDCPEVKTAPVVIDRDLPWLEWPEPTFTQVIEELVPAQRVAHRPVYDPYVSHRVPQGALRQTSSNAP